MNANNIFRYYQIAITYNMIRMIQEWNIKSYVEINRKGVYYLSVGAAGFLIFILGLAVLRVIVFCLLWLVTVGRHHLWLFPNLTEDVGFFASFWPLWKVISCTKTYDFFHQLTRTVLFLITVWIQGQKRILEEEG